MSRADDRLFLDPIVGWVVVGASAGGPNKQDKGQQTADEPQVGWQM